MGNGSGAANLDQVLLQVEALGAGVEDPMKAELGGRVGDDVAADPDLFTLSHAIDLYLVWLAKGLDCVKKR